MTTARSTKNAASVATSLAVIAILLTGGFLAYATGNSVLSARPRPADDNSNNQTGSAHGSTFELSLVPRVDSLQLPEGIDCSYGRGHATLSVNSTAAFVSLELGDAVPNGTYTALLVADGVNYTVGEFATGSEGAGAFHGAVQFTSEPSTLALRLIFDGAVPPGCISMDLTTVPPQVTLSTGQTSTGSSSSTTTEKESTLTGNRSRAEERLDFRLLPVHSGASLPSWYRVGQGDATVSINGTVITAAAELSSNPNTTFTLFLVLGGSQGSASPALYSLGNFTTDGRGGGHLSAEASVPPGTYYLGMRVYDNSTFGSPVVVLTSIPSAVQVSLSAGSSSSSSSSSTSTTTTISKGTQENHTSSGEGEGKPSYSSTLSLAIKPVPVLHHEQNASSSLPAFSSGNATLTARGRTVGVVVNLFGSRPNSNFTVTVTFGEHNVTLGPFFASQGGTAHLEANATLDPGTYLVSLLVYEGSSGSSSPSGLTMVGVGSPSPAGLLVTGSVTSTTSTTATSSSATETEGENQTLGGGFQALFRLTGVASVPGAPSGYRIGSGAVLLQLNDGMLEALISIRAANPNTQYNLVVELGGGRNVTAGTLVTNAAGNGEMKTALPVGPGTFTLGVAAYDVSTFSAPTMVMSGYQSGSVVVGSSPPPAQQQQQTNASSTESERHQATVVNAPENEITSAMDNGTIPAVIHISGSETHFTVLNHNFSISVGRASGNGIVITVSAENVTGPRTFLINLNGTTAQGIQSGSLQVLFDGQAISEASSLSEVLSPKPGSNATYAIVETAGGVQMLVAVPHFSVHTIEILGIPLAAVQNLLEVDAPLLAASVAAVTLLFGAIYATRRRLYSFL